MIRYDQQIILDHFFIIPENIKQAEGFVIIRDNDNVPDKQVFGFMHLCSELSNVIQIDLFGSVPFFYFNLTG